LDAFRAVLVQDVGPLTDDGRVTPLAQLRALQALDEAGLPRPSSLRPASSVTNEVWIADDVVIRINRRVDGRLRREAALAQHLPPELGYPEIVAYGGRPGADFLIVRRVNGAVLSRCWPAMTSDDRRRAVRQLAGKLRLLHSTRTPQGLPPLDAPQLLEAGTFTPVARLEASLARVRTLPFVDGHLVDTIGSMVRELAPTIMPFGDNTLVHGDLTFENVLWDGQRITAVLDFEWSRGAPCDVELDVLLRMCAYPFLHVAADYEKQTRPVDYVDVPRWLADDDPELFGAPRLADRLTLYAIAYDIRELLAFPPQGQARSLSPYHPLNRLQNTVRGASHLAWLHRAAV
jgi:aminoglycoside phosphotransferase (APT) family kinase protein